MILKNYNIFKESKIEDIQTPWIYNDSFIVSYHMITDGKFNQKLPDEVNGNFYCSGLGLTSLEGCPKIISKGFDCSHNKLSNLIDFPEYIGNECNISYNYLTSLEGCREVINGVFDCSNNKLENLKGSPKEIKDNFDCSFNNLTSLEGFPSKIFGKLFLYDNNQLKSLEHINYKPEQIVVGGLDKKDLHIQKNFINSKFWKGKETYWINLLQYMTYENIELDNIKIWPNEFIESLDDYHKNLFKSYKGIIKFNL